MLQHTVLFKLKEDIALSMVDKILAEAREKLVRIPGVSNLRAGIPAFDNEEWDFCLSMDIPGPAELEAYRTHPLHVAYVTDFIRPNTTDRRSLDFIMES
jgi:hypothetical protein